MADQAQHVGTFRGGQWSILLSGDTGSRAGGPTDEDGGFVFQAGSNGSIVWDIQALPLGTNSTSVVLYIWIYNVATENIEVLLTRALGTSTAPAAGSQYTTPTNGVISINDRLPVIDFPNSKTTTPNRGVRINPYNKIYAGTDQLSGGSGWQINFYGGDW